jgi:pyruvate dehydrogenase E2 component (dihydrolipoamide acetyltransferase)
VVSALKEIRVPDIGDFKDVAVIEILVKPGDAIAVDDTVIVLESDKATLDVPSPSAGIVRAVNLAVGDRVSEGTIVLTLEERAVGEAAAAAPAVAAIGAPLPNRPAAVASAPAAPPIAPMSVAPPHAATGSREPHASPSLRRFARELGVDLGLVTGSGAKGRILKEDVQGFVKAALAKSAGGTAGPGVIGANGGLNLLPWPQVDFAKFGPIERSPLSKIKKISGANLWRNWVMIPHVTNFDEADITELEAFRVSVNKETGSKVTMLAFLIKAAVASLKKFPTFNASLEGEELVLKRYFHIGFAADTPNGLVVPVIRDADRKGILEIAAEAAQLSALARDGKLKPTDMQGGCFTVSSLGGIGGSGFTPIINAPEIAILGATRAQMKPVWDGQQFQPRLILPISLSWDHRVIDGAAAARFLVALSGLLADFRRIAL